MALAEDEPEERLSHRPPSSAPGKPHLRASCELRSNTSSKASGDRAQAFRRMISKALILGLDQDGIGDVDGRLDAADGLVGSADVICESD